MRTTTRVIATAGMSALLLTGAATAASAAPAVPEQATNSTVQQLDPQSAAEAGVTLKAPAAPDKQERQGFQGRESSAAVPFSVNMAYFDESVRSGNQSAIIGTSDGFSDGNWVNVWIRGKGDTQWTDSGGNWVRAGKFSIPVTYPTTGDWQVQLSLGAWPEEQYSQIGDVTVKPGWSTKPNVVSGGFEGKRYLKVEGAANGKPDSTVHLWVNQPGKWFPTRVGSTTVDSAGHYTFTEFNSKMALNKKGHYVVTVSSKSNLSSAFGVTVYTNR
jgi:hypothetical protein